MLGKMATEIYSQLEKRKNAIELLDDLEDANNNSEVKELSKILNKLMNIKLNELGKTYFEVIRENKVRENQLKRLNAWEKWLQDNKELLE